MQYTQHGHWLRYENSWQHQTPVENTNDPSGCQAGVTPTITYTVVDLQELRSPLDLLDTK